MPHLQRFWKSVKETIIHVLYQVPMCKEIVRRAGVRPEPGGEIEQVGAFPRTPYQRVLYALTKNSEADGDWSWKGFGAPGVSTGEGGRVFNGGPPCSVVALHRAVLNDPDIMTGVGHQDERGHTYGSWAHQGGGGDSRPPFYAAPPRSTLVGRTFGLQEFDLPLMSLWPVYGPDDLNGYLRAHLVLEMRLVAYLTRTVGHGEFRVELSFGGDSREYVLAHDGSAGRFVSDWLAVPDADQDDDRTELRLFSSVTASYKILDEDGGNAPSQMSDTVSDLDGYLGIPFCELELRADYRRHVDLWIQDAYTPPENTTL